MRSDKPSHGASASLPLTFSFSEISKQTPYSEKYLNLLARLGRIEAHKEGRNWVTNIEAVKNYIKGRQRQR